MQRRRRPGGRTPRFGRIGNLTTRLAVLDGGLGTARDDDWFELTARAPSPLPTG